MLLEASPASSHLLARRPFSLTSPSPISYSAAAAPRNSPASLFLNLRSSSPAMCVAEKSLTLPGVVFEPFEEVKKEMELLPSLPHLSLARQEYSEECEAAVNEQIKNSVSFVWWNVSVEYSMSYAYHAMYAYFDRDNIALKGLAKFFKESSEEERGHAEKLMEYQNKRGGRVKFHPILMPASEFNHAEKGDALYAMELALSLEKLTNEKLLKLHHVADKNKDVELTDFVESEFLDEQVESIKKISEYVAQLRRVGQGHGVYHFNQMLLHDEVAA